MFVLECVICRWQTNRFEDDPKFDEGIPPQVRAYLGRHIKSKHPEYKLFSDWELSNRFGHKVRVKEAEE